MCGPRGWWRPAVHPRRRAQRAGQSSRRPHARPPMPAHPRRCATRVERELSRPDRFAATGAAARALDDKVARIWAKTVGQRGKSWAKELAEAADVSEVTVYKKR